MEPTKIPTDYIPGYKEAQAIDRERADNYVAHTVIGDPLADELAETLVAVGGRERNRLLQAGMEGQEDALRDAPAIVRKFFDEASTPPDWVDLAGFRPGFRLFHRNSNLALGAMVGGTLVEGFSTNISKSFFITGRVRDQGVRRLRQNNRHMVEIFIPGGLERTGDGWKLSVRIRVIHGMVRRLLNNSDEWDSEAWGEPISAAHVGFAITAFSARLLKHLRDLGAKFDDEERASFMQVWRYSGYLMGIPETILFHDEEDALRTYRIGLVCEPEVSMESISMANSLINAAPLVVGITEPAERRSLSSYVYRVSRALIGSPLADKLQYPHNPTLGVLWSFRMQNRYDNFMNRLFKSRNQKSNKMAALLDASAFDEGGITYQMPDHVYAEESRGW